MWLTFLFWLFWCLFILSLSCKLVYKLILEQSSVWLVERYVYNYLLSCDCSHTMKLVLIPGVVSILFYVYQTSGQQMMFIILLSDKNPHDLSSCCFYNCFSKPLATLGFPSQFVVVFKIFYRNPCTFLRRLLVTTVVVRLQLSNNTTWIHVQCQTAPFTKNFRASLSKVKCSHQ